MRGAHQYFDCKASSLITPPNGGSGAGSCLPLIVVVALGEPGTPVICWAEMGAADSMAAMTNARITDKSDPVFILSPLIQICCTMGPASPPRLPGAVQQFLLKPVQAPGHWQAYKFSVQKFFKSKNITLNVPKNRFGPAIQRKSPIHNSS